MAGPEHNHWLAQQQAVRNLGLERAKKTAPDKKHSGKFIFITLGVVVLFIALMYVISNAADWIYFAKM